MHMYRHNVIVCCVCIQCIVHGVASVSIVAAVSVNLVSLTISVGEMHREERKKR